jgi:isopenicillin-N epimerase
VAYLNHGSFGACPRAVLEAQARLRERMEAEPVRFLARGLEGLLDAARAELGRFLGADADDLAFLPNATAGVNTVLRSLRFRRGDEILTTDHAYNACRNALERVAGRTGACVVTAAVPFPIDHAERVVEAVLARVSARTRLAVLDHVTSPTALVFPIERLVAELGARGVDTLVDGAHAPGMLPLDVRALGAAYYAGNCHKWLCAPKGAAFLHVRRDRQSDIGPLAVSHGANSPRTDRSRFRLEFDWTGTHDPTAYLAVPEAISHVGSLLPGGWPAVMDRNRATARAARERLSEALEIEPPCPAGMLGSMAALPLPAGVSAPSAPAGPDPLQAALFERFGVEVPVYAWGTPSSRLLRVSAHLYNTPEDFDRLVQALRSLAAV